MKNQGKTLLLVSIVWLGIPLVAFSAPPVNTFPPAVTVLEDTDFNVKGITVTDADNNLATVKLSVNHGKLTVSGAAESALVLTENGGSTLTLTGSQNDINSALSNLIFKGDLNYVGSDVLTIFSTDSEIPAEVDTDQIGITINRPEFVELCTSYQKTPNEGEHIGDVLPRVSVGSVINYSLVRYNLSDKKSSFNAQAFGFGMAFRYYSRGQLDQAGEGKRIGDIPLACRARTTDLLNFNQVPLGQKPKIGSTISVSPTFYVFKDEDENDLGTQLALNFGFLNDFLTIGVGWNLSGRDAGEWFLLAGPSIGFQF